MRCSWSHWEQAVAALAGRDWRSPVMSGFTAFARTLFTSDLRRSVGSCLRDGAIAILIISYLASTAGTHQASTRWGHLRGI
jgi:hypothetical protein